MPRYGWTERFIDDRFCTVVAESLEEAREKRAEGYWASEQTVDFQSTGEATELVEIEHSGGD